MRGSETITIHPKPEVDWQGDPTGVPASPYDISGCIIWPVIRPDDGSVIPQVFDVYIPEGTLGPQDVVEAREYDDWTIDGGTEGRYITKGGRDKGVIIRIKRIA